MMEKKAISLTRWCIANWANCTWPGGQSNSEKFRDNKVSIIGQKKKSNKHLSLQLRFSRGLARTLLSNISSRSTTTWYLRRNYCEFGCLVTIKPRQPPLPLLVFFSLLLRVLHSAPRAPHKHVTTIVRPWTKIHADSPHSRFRFRVRIHTESVFVFVFFVHAVVFFKYTPLFHWFFSLSKFFY